MRASPWFLVLVVGLTSGCNLFRGYYTPANHFPYGTAVEERTSKSVVKAATTMEIILKNRDFVIIKSEKNEETAQIRADKNNIEYVIDFKGGEQGCVAHIEVEQAGNDLNAWELLKELNLYP